MSLLGIFVLLASASCLQGTVEVADGADGVEVSHLPIYGGSEATLPEHDAVVALHTLSRGYVYTSPFCSGTLIEPDVVLTAAHCMVEVRGLKVKDKRPDAVAIYVGDNPADDILSHLYLVSEIAVHPSYNPVQLTDDIALIRLANPINEPVTPVPALPMSAGFSEADAGLNLNFAGFGVTETGSFGEKLQVDLPLAGLGCVVSGCPDSGVASTQISYDQGAIEGPCSGDSGGPAFIERDGTVYVAGITSYGDSACTDYGVSTRVDAFENFIADFVAGAPTPPDCSEDAVCNADCAEGEDPDCATTPTDCGDGVCGVGESCDGRDGTSECNADCAGRSTGKPSGRYCEVEGVCIGSGCP